MNLKLTDRERKLILTYHKLTKLPVPTILSALICAVLIIPLAMIDGLVFKSQGFFPYGLYIMFFVVTVNMVIFAYSTLRVRWGFRSKAWKAILEKLETGEIQTKSYTGQAVGTIALGAAGRALSRSKSNTAKAIGGAAQVASAVSAVSLVDGMTKESRSIIERVAYAAGVTLSKTKYTLLILLASTIPIVAVYIPRYFNSYQEHQQAIIAAKDAYSQIETILQEDINNKHDYVGGLWNPDEGYREDGYTINRHFYYDDDVGARKNACISFDIANTGRISDAVYSIDIDVSLSKEENLARIEKYIRVFNEMISKIKVPAERPELLQTIVIPETFLQKFVNSSYYEELRETTATMQFSYYTENENEYDKYSMSYICITIPEEKGE